MTVSNPDTIFAVATARGRSGVAVFRISGPAAHQALAALAGQPPEPGRLSLRNLRDPASGEIIDEALVLSFAEGRSFTGESSAEIQTHGSAAVIGALTGILGAMQGLRQATAGEFTRRALENGRLDLAEVEGLGDLIAAETEAQRRAALQVFRGEFSLRVEVWRRDLLRVAALQAAMIDFADEDVPDLTREVLDLVASTRDSIRREVEGSRARERLRDGFEVAIVGRPNVGKSTLLNALAGRDAALTSEIAGTTRDIIEVRMDLGGLPVTLLDTAGLRPASDPVEAMGVDRAVSRAVAADLRVFLLDRQSGELPAEVEVREGDVVVFGKADLTDGDGPAVSGKTGLGIDSLLGKIEATLSARLSGDGLATRDRHFRGLVTAAERLGEAETTLGAAAGHEDIAAENVLAAIRALDSIIGRVDVEQILGEVFAGFCIGK